VRSPQGSDEDVLLQRPIDTFTTMMSLAVALLINEHKGGINLAYR
jgi:hypothetical protein